MDKKLVGKSPDVCVHMPDCVYSCLVPVTSQLANNIIVSKGWLAQRGCH